MLTGVYDPCRPQNKAEFWNELLQIRIQWGGPWLIGGNFNVIRFIHEKSRPNVITRSMRDFNDMINQCDLRDSPLLRAKYTWTDGKEHPLLSRLDRFLVSNCWEEVYPHFTQEVLPKLLRIISQLCSIHQKLTMALPHFGLRICGLHTHSLGIAFVYGGKKSTWRDMKASVC